MIHVKIGDCELDINGHAGYAEPGKDIVCAAVSALAYTLIENLSHSDCGLFYEYIPGRMIIKCDSTEKTRDMFLFASRGFHGIAQNYPQYVNCKEK